MAPRRFTIVPFELAIDLTHVTLRVEAEFKIYGGTANSKKNYSLVLNNCIESFVFCWVR